MIGVAFETKSVVELIIILNSLLDKVKDIFNSERESSKSKLEQTVIAKTASVNCEQLKTVLLPNDDLTIRNVSIEGCEVVIMYIEGMVDKKIINENILQTMMNKKQQQHEEDLYHQFKKKVISLGDVKEVKELEKVIEGVLAGDTVIFIDGYQRALVASTRSWESRGVEKPTNETSIRGPKESFTETLQINTSLLRRKIRNSKLKFESMQLGEVTNTQVSLSYLEGISNPKLVDELKKRLEKIEVDAILDVENIKELVTDASFSPLPTVYKTERPDTVASKLLEGKIAILVDGSPEALVMPAVFMEFLLDASDYYLHPVIATTTRWLRFISLFTTLFLPALYVAIIDYHPEMLPTSLIISLAAAREGIPFPPVVETTIMGLLFEVLREAGLRMPRNLGQAVSIVGALIIGEAAVKAGFVSIPIVIVAALTGLTIFTIPSSELALALVPMRFVFTILAAILGLFGILLGQLLFLIHLASLRSLGVPYLSPLAPMNAQEFKDVLVRAPWWSMNFRPKTSRYNKGDRVRQSAEQKPKPPKNKEKEVIHQED
ncbi:MAG: spore germination protein [Bacillota bacterium]